MVSKESKGALTVLIVTMLLLERVESGVCGSYTTMYTSNAIIRKGRKNSVTVASCPCQEGRLLCEPSVLGV